MEGYDIGEINPYIIHCLHVNKNNCPPSGTDYGIRCVKWYELEFILWGEGHIITENKKLMARKGDVFFRKPGMEVQGFAPYHSYLVVFDMVHKKNKAPYFDPNPFELEKGSNSKVSKSIDRRNEGINLPNVMNILRFTAFEQLFSDCYNEFIYNRKESRFFMKTYIMQILSMLYNELASVDWQHHPGRSIPANHPKVIEVKKYIDNNIQSKLCLDELAQVAGLSPNFLCKIFKDIIGDTPINYINKGKINLAKKLLIETNVNIKEISYTCGFENDTYFFTLFKRLECLTPSAFRERQRIMFLYQ